LAAWIRIREKLESPEGDKYFETLHNNPVPKIKGTLIKTDPPGKPTELTLGIVDPSQVEIVVKLATELPNDADAGTVVEIEGTADSYHKAPFGFLILSEPAKITGWPAPPAPVRKKLN
jgi:hypothetical protein